MPYMLSICFLYASYNYMLPICFLYASRWYVRNYVSSLNFWQNIWSCCAGTSVTRLKPGCVAEPVAGAMAGALLPKNNAKNDWDWVPKRSSFICVCVANMTGKWFFSSMTLTTSLFYELHSEGKPWVIYTYVYLPKHLHSLPVLIRKGQESVSSGKSRQLGNFYPT